MDLTKQFESRLKKREAEKQQKLEELYESHDRRALEVTELAATNPSSATAQQETALMEEMKSERDKLVAHFDKDTDLKQKILISGVQ